MADNSVISRTEQGRFKPGQSGNPAGRPPAKRYFAEALRRVGLETVQVDTNEGPLEVTRFEAVARQLFDMAAKGDKGAAKLIGERTDGNTLTAEEEARLERYRRFGPVAELERFA